MRTNKVFTVSVRVIDSESNDKTFNIDIDEGLYDIDDIELAALEAFNEHFGLDMSHEDCDYHIELTDTELLELGIENVDELQDFCEIFYSDDNYYDFEVFQAASDCDYDWDMIADGYCGKWEDDEDFVRNLLEDSGDLPKDLPHYICIDWERTAEAIMMDYQESNGHYFRQ